MYAKTICAGLALLAVMATAGCPRNPKGDTTIVTPPGDTTTNVDINKTDSTTTTTTTPPVATNPDGTPVTPPDGIATPTTEPPVEGDVATPPAEDTAPAGGTVVVLETTKGNIEIAIHEDWAPIGAAHFVELVKAGYYNGAPWFRVIPGFMGQTGLAGDPALTKQWMEKTIQDEPVKKGNLRGMVVYGKSGAPNSRSTHIFINLVDNSSGLDRQGFAAFGEVVTGMDVVDKLFPIPDEALSGAGLSQGSLTTAEGLAKFKEKFPEADYINKAYVKE
jgi:peptidyl-prolyl cis-trans isomerase A (cyclophilin A)